MKEFSKYVGLDVHKAIVDNIYLNTNDYAHNTFIMPDFALNLIHEGKLGKKSGIGLYKTEIHESGKKTQLVYDITTNSYREKIQYSFPFAETMVSYLRVGDYDNAFKTLIVNRSIEAELCLEFLIKYVIYSLTASGLVGYDFDAADDVMGTGFNWCPPIAVIEALFGIENFRSLVKERLSKDLLINLDVDNLLSNVKCSKYDFRRYIKAKK